MRTPVHPKVLWPTAEIVTKLDAMWAMILTRVQPDEDCPHDVLADLEVTNGSLEPELNYLGAAKNVVLRRRPTPAELAAIKAELTARGDLSGDVFCATVAISKVPRHVGPDEWSEATATMLFDTWTEAPDTTSLYARVLQPKPDGPHHAVDVSPDQDMSLMEVALAVDTILENGRITAAVVSAVVQLTEGVRASVRGRCEDLYKFDHALVTLMETATQCMVVLVPFSARTQDFGRPAAYRGDEVFALNVGASGHLLRPRIYHRGAAS